MRLFFIILTLIILGVALLTLLRSPRTDREWEPHQAPTPVFSPQTDGVWRLSPLREYAFDASGPVRTDWRDISLRPNDLSEIWFFVEPFAGWDGVGHTFLSFVFEGKSPQVVSVSVEARKEVGEEYSALRGLFNAYELLYQWSTEQDIVTRITQHLGHDLYAYKLDVSPEQARAILDHFIQRTNRLHARPRFYNTITSNCTNELAKAVNEAYPGALPWRREHVFTGRSDRYLLQRGFIAGDGDYQEVRERANIREIISGLSIEDPDAFSARWRRIRGKAIASN